MYPRMKNSTSRKEGGDDVGCIQVEKREAMMKVVDDLNVHLETKKHTSG